MELSTQRRLAGTILVCVFVGGVFQYQDFKRHAAERYMNNAKLAEALKFLPPPTAQSSNQNVFITSDDNNVTIHFAPRSRTEFDRAMEGSRRKGRPGLEHWVVTWRGVDYNL